VVFCGLCIDLQNEILHNLPLLSGRLFLQESPEMKGILNRVAFWRMALGQMDAKKGRFGPSVTILPNKSSSKCIKHIYEL
jgi:hypothetical protein